MKKVMKVVWYCLVMALCTAGVATASDSDLEQAFAGLDQAVVPALFYTSAANQVQSEAALTLLNREWAGFRASYGDYRPDYANWGAYVDGIEQEMLAANSIVFSGTAPLVDAHEALEGIRIILIDFRLKNGFPKFMTDKLTLYHDPMEAIALTVKGKTPLTLSDAAVAFVAESLPAAEKAWATAERCPVDPEVWGFTPAQMLTFYNAMANERLALEKLQTALESGDKQAIIVAGLGLKQNFVPVYTFFGDFKSVAQLVALGQ
jgi:hypothetical protein